MKALHSYNPQLLPYWLVSILFIAGFSIFGRRVQLAITEIIDQRWIAGTVFLLLVAILAWLHYFRNKDKRISLVTIVAILLLIAGGVAVSRGYLQPVEVVHFLLFSWLGWISASTFGIVYGMLAILAVSLGDEVLQYFLPDRVGDLQDIIINTISGFVGLILRGK